MLRTPILLLVYNRPDLTAQVLATLKTTRPRTLFIAADGPNPTRPCDEAKCREVRDLLRREIDWECHVTPRFSEQNLGCRKGVSTAITWFFDHVEAGIILEDDVIPTPGFFPFCEAMLATYRHHESIFHITGDNFLFGRKRGWASAYFSRYPSVWGWATWRRAWCHYNTDAPHFHALATEDTGAPPWNPNLGDPAADAFWLNFFRKTARGHIDSWAFQWVFTLLWNQALATVPNMNLVSNIGFRPDATHTRETSPMANLPGESCSRLTLPHKITADTEADRFLFRHVHQGQPLPPMTLAERLHAWIWRTRQHLGI